MLSSFAEIRRLISSEEEIRDHQKAKRHEHSTSNGGVN